MNYATIRDEMRNLWLGQRDLRDRASRGDLKGKRTPAQVDRYSQILDAIGAVGAELNIIAANAASYEAWKATLPKAGAKA
jgi:hypothetical protein